MRRWMLVVALAAGVAGPAIAGPEIQLTIKDGRVWLVAKGATPRDILREWSRIGHTNIVNADRITGSPMTLELAGVPEQQALDVVLQAASGFLAVPRQSLVADASNFDRIVIMPPSTAPPDARPPAMAAGPNPQGVFAPPPAPVGTYPPGVQRIIGPDGQPVPDDQQGAPYPAVAPVQVGPPVQGFAGGPNSQPSGAPPTNSPTPTAAPGVPVPGMVVAPPAQTRPGQPGQPTQTQTGTPAPGQPTQIQSVQPFPGQPYPTQQRPQR